MRGAMEGMAKVQQAVAVHARSVAVECRCLKIMVKAGWEGTGEKLLQAGRM